MKKTMIILALVLVATTSTLFAMAKPVKEKVPNKIDPTGVYALIAVDGAKLPATISHGAKMKVYSGTFTINVDKTCSSEIIFGPPSGDKSTRLVKATYTQEGSILHMKWIGAGRTTGTIKGNIFTMNNEGMMFVYKKNKEK